MKLNKGIWIPQVFATVLLLMALIPGMIYGYYILLRIFCTGVFLYLVYNTSKAKTTFYPWLYGLMASLYNPVIPVHLTRGI